MYNFYSTLSQPCLVLHNCKLERKFIFLTTRNFQQPSALNLNDPLLPYGKKGLQMLDKILEREKFLDAKNQWRMQIYQKIKNCFVGVVFCEDPCREFPQSKHPLLMRSSQQKTTHHMKKHTIRRKIRKPNKQGNDLKNQK